jgi:hypothetical protein
VSLFSSWSVFVLQEARSLEHRLDFDLELELDFQS